MPVTGDLKPHRNRFSLENPMVLFPDALFSFTEFKTHVYNCLYLN